ncbi:MAG: hypothetical protein U1E35_09315 [Rhodospirillales bacterium]
MRNLNRAHTLQAGDMDGDGDADRRRPDAHPAEAIMVLDIVDGRGKSRQWQVREIGGGGLHNGVVADIDRDGHPDLFGANWIGNPPVRLWLNRR